MSPARPNPARSLIGFVLDPPLRWVRLFALGCIGLGLASLFLPSMAPSGSLKLGALDVRVEQGRAFVAPLMIGSSRFFILTGDDIGAPRASLLVLYEDNVALGPAHAPHSEIREKGGGRYSHWGTGLWFSTPDGTDPRLNGRTYRVDYRMSVRPEWRLTGLVCLVLGLSVAMRGRSTESRAKSGFVGRLLAKWARPAEIQGRVLTVLLLGGLLVGAGAIVAGWYWGETSLTGVAVARFLPVSDAFGYHSCATAISLTGTFDQPFGGAWCSRRALYPAMLASMLALTGWDSQLVLILQGALGGVSIAAFAVQIAAQFGRVPGVVASILLAAYAWQFVLGLFMTEVAGFVLGLGGLAVLLGASERGQPLALALGTALISIGLSARAGVLFALPAIVVWSVIAFWQGARRRTLATAGWVFVGAMTGPLLQVAFVWALGADPFHTGSNFAVTLYGLSTGSRDWSEAYRTFAHLFEINEAEAFKEAYRQAIGNILARPAVFAAALVAASHAYVTALFLFHDLWRDGETLWQVLAALGMVWCITNLRRPAASLLLVLMLAEAAAAPLIFDSGGNRVFAATIAVRIVLVAVGLQWLLQWLARWAGHRDAERPRLSGRLPTPAVVVISCVGPVLMLLALTPLPRLLAPHPSAATDCAAPMLAIAANLHRESQSMHIVDGSAPVASIWPFSITPQRLAGDQRIDQTWFGQDFLGLPPRTTVIRAVDLGKAQYGAVHPVVLRGHGPLLPGRYVLCVNPKEGLDLAGVRHRLVEKATLLERR